MNSQPALERCFGLHQLPVAAERRGGPISNVSCTIHRPSTLSAYLLVPIEAKDDPHEEAFPIQIAVKPDLPSAGVVNRNTEKPVSASTLWNLGRIP